MLIYKVTNRTNGKVYIGKHAGDAVDARFRQHVGDAMRQSRLYFHNAIRKYGADAFKVETLYFAKTTDELSKMETFFIILHQSHKSENGYNMTMGGDGASMGHIVSSETGRAISRAKKGKSFSSQHKQALSVAKKDCKLSETHKQAIAASIAVVRGQISRGCRDAWDVRTPEYKAWLVRKAAATRWGNVFIEPKPDIHFKSEATPCKL